LSTLGGLLSLRRWLGLATLLALGGCVQQAVLENDVTSAMWKARTLATATDVRLAEAALATQLVELEALYQRNPDDARVHRLLEYGYSLMARGFIEARRLDAIAAGDDAEAEQERRLQSDAEARARYYQPRSSPSPRLAMAPGRPEQQLTDAEQACRKRDRTAYERELSRVLGKHEIRPEARLEHALARRLAAAWLMPKVAARCRFEASSATSAAPKAPPPTFR
jgi:hypothetical protein